MDLSKQSLSQLRQRVAALTASEDRESWIDALRRDSRQGARDLADRLERRLAAEHAEGLRLDALFERQRALHARGVRHVAGIDEVGMGPLAGPVVAAAVVLPANARLDGLDDSKRLSPRARERLDGRIREQAEAFAIAEVPVDEIDRINVHRAGLEAMRRAVEQLPLEPDHLLVDARRVPGVVMPQTPVVGGDALEASIAAASILAKVHRDALMCEMDRLYPGYGFASHKGYGTEAHLDALQRLGPSPIHRQSFAPVSGRVAR
ncbi:ribonuclease HII [Myxococcota bacterium]|nr:ribonuclease HII [Myxococcota bacterium]